jgi:hypothetical protein
MLDEFSIDYSVPTILVQDSLCADSCSFAKRFLLVFETHQNAFFGSKQPRNINSSPIQNNPGTNPLPGGAAPQIKPTIFTSSETNPSFMAAPDAS